MPDSTENASFKELRLGLVCYGGVSLAIYMHGVIKEIHKLLIASRAYEQDPAGANPFPEASAERAYWDVLRRAERDQHVRTRVVVDVISGTSAGGINGIILAKAISRNRSQESLTRLWFERGDIKELAGGFFAKLGKGLSIVGAALLPKVKTRPPLRGNRMLGWLRDAFVGIDESDRPTAGVRGLEDLDTLVPDGQELELFVTTTDFFGYTLDVVIADPPAVQEKRHRHVFRFRHGGGQFAAAYNEMLALAARATSSFPGAFPPVTLAQLDEVLEVPAQRREGYEAEFFREYQLSRESLADAYFVDGGVLDNKPFGHTLRAIAERPAAVEVDRRLVYLQPDPRYEPPPEDAREPSLTKTAWGGLSSIAGYEPILDDILEVDRYNCRVRRIREIVHDCRDEVLTLLDEVGAFAVDAPLEELAGLRRRIQERTRELLGRSETAHHLLRVHSVVDQFAWGISLLRRFPEGTNASNWVRAVVRRWAEDRGFVGADADLGEQRKLLETFDLGFTRRRILFVLQGVNLFYARLARGEDVRPGRSELDAAKAALYKELSAIRNMIWGRDLPSSARDGIAELFPVPEFDFDRQTLAENAASFLDQGDRRARLDGLLDQLGRHLSQRREAVRAELFRDFHALTSGWRDDARREVLMRYLGFPFWDTLIYPLQALAGGGELDEVQCLRMSPEDSKLLDPGDLSAGRTAAKVKGIGKGHFAAFFDRAYRENDYLWGRLDAAERLVAMVLGSHRPDPRAVKPAFLAILEEETQRPLATIGETLARLRRSAEAL